MNVRASLAAAGVYRSRRSLRMSLSREVTDAMIDCLVMAVLLWKNGGLLGYFGLFYVVAIALLWQALTTQPPPAIDCEHSELRASHDEYSEALNDDLFYLISSAALYQISLEFSQSPSMLRNGTTCDIEAGQISTAALSNADDGQSD